MHNLGRNVGLDFVTGAVTIAHSFVFVCPSVYTNVDFMGRDF